MSEPTWVFLGWHRVMTDTGSVLAKLYTPSWSETMNRSTGDE